MIPAVRQQSIVRSLQQRGSQTVGDLATSLKVSPSTIRRDLSLMEDSGLLRRSFGGAMLVERDDPIGQTHLTNTEAKVAIGAAASGLMGDGATVIIDIGSTALALAESLRGRDLTVITASLPVFGLLAHERRIRIILLGGGYRPDYQCTAGHLTVAALREVRADIAFLGCTGIAFNGMIRDNTADQVPVKRAILQSADESILLADATKFPGLGTYTVAHLEDLSRLVTNAPVSTPLRKRLAEAGTEVLHV